VCANLLNTNEYMADLIVTGAAGPWTDASWRLAGAVWHYRANQIGIVDWGYLNGLRMMYEGDLNLFVIDRFATDAGRGHILGMIAAPDSVFIQHTGDKQVFSGVNEQLRAIAQAAGYEEQVQRTVHDNQGRPVFEIVRFVKGS